MLDRIFKSCSACFAVAGATLVAPFAVAATPSNFDSPTSTVHAFRLDGNELPAKTLANIRGGFDLAPNISINFGFSQIDSLGQNIIQSIIVPITTLTDSRNSASATISGSGGTTVAQLQSLGAAIPSGGSGTTNVTPQTTQQTTTSNASSTTNVQANTSSVSVTSTANQGQTTFLTQLAGSGITNLVQNQANNQLIQQVTTISIGITGMSQWLSQQRANSSVANGFAAP
jgi:hypothetical protein